MITRFYLNPDNSLREVHEAGRCSTYWWLYRRFVADSSEDNQRALGVHISICPECQAWIERCDEASQEVQMIEIEPCKQAHAKREPLFVAPESKPVRRASRRNDRPALGTWGLL